MWDYSEKVKDHFTHPHNVGEIVNPDAVGEVGSLVCGDALKLFLKVDSRTEKISEAKFQTFGCGSAIASSSILTDMIIGKTLAEASRITNRDIAEALGGLPQEKMHCSVMGMEALEAAIANYRGQAAASHEEEEGAEIVCKCFGVTDRKIERAVRENRLKTVEEVTNYTKAGGACASCHWKIDEIIRRVWQDMGDQAQKAAEKPMTNLRRMQLVQETLDREVRPELKKDGGGLELVDIEGKVVKVRLLGMCAGCQVANFTLRDMVGKKLREFVEPDIEVVEIKE
ncbi:Fe-S cluster assembly protein NifU [candidate division FCPU426 bacterium]|nr:Fe-S cluster assembly protein NifU [candidate division FCPU426 bacterium]